MTRLRLRSAAVLAAAVLLTAGGLPGAFADPFADPSLENPPANLIRSLSTPRHLWYAITYDLPANDEVLVRMRATVDAGWTAKFCGSLSALPGPNLALGSTILTPARDGSGDDQMFVGVESEGTSDVIVEPEPTMRGGRVRRMCFSRVAAGPDDATVRRSEVFFFAADTPVRDVALTVHADPGVRIVAESWGTGGVQVVRDSAFSGGSRAASGYRERVSGYRDPVVSFDSNASRDRTFVRTYQRSASAWFVAGYHQTHQAASYSNFAALLSVKGPGRPIGTYRGDPVTGEDDVTYTIGNTYFAGLEPGTYRYKIDALLAARLDTALVGVEALMGRTGTDPWVVLATLDADMPPCARSRTIWHARDGHRVCGPGPWRMKRGLRL